MGLFSSKSRSSSVSTTQNFQETNALNASLSGVVATNAPVLSGSGNTAINYFSSDVAGSFNSLVDLVGGAFDNVADLTGETLKSLEQSNTSSLNAIVEANQQVQNPTFNALADTITKVIPLAMFGIGALVIIRTMPSIKGMFK